METRGASFLLPSANGLMAEPSLVTYCTTKAGIIGMTKSMATDVGKYNIRVNCICPTYTEHHIEETSGFRCGPEPNVGESKQPSFDQSNRGSGRGRKADFVPGIRRICHHHWHRFSCSRWVDVLSLRFDAMLGEPQTSNESEAH